MVFAEYILLQTNGPLFETRKHWVQRITYTAETNATRVQSQLGGHTHTALRRAPQYLLCSLSDAAKVINEKFNFQQLTTKSF